MSGFTCSIRSIVLQRLLLLFNRIEEKLIKYPETTTGGRMYEKTVQPHVAAGT